MVRDFVNPLTLQPRDPDVLFVMPNQPNLLASRRGAGGGHLAAKDFRIISGTNSDTFAKRRMISTVISGS